MDKIVAVGELWQKQVESRVVQEMAAVGRPRIQLWASYMRMQAYIHIYMHICIYMLHIIYIMHTIYIIYVVI